MGILRSVSRGVALTGAVVAGGALAVTARSVLATPQPLESALEGESRIFRFREGDIFYKVSGSAGAQPVLLLHGAHLSASSFEWRRNFSALSQEFRVYAPDLLGFGLSDRPALDYSANTFVTLISDFTREVVGRPALVVARGQSAAFSTRAAYLDPQLFTRLVLISPTGIATAAPDGLDGPMAVLRNALRRVTETTAGEVPYAFLTTKSALSLFVARQSYAHSEQITPDLVRYLFATTHQHGARFAPLAFMTGKLDLEVANDFVRLQQPVLLVWGEQDAINEPLHSEALRLLNPRARLELISSAGNAVQDEQPTEINELLRAWFLAPVELVDPSRQQGTLPAGERAAASTAARPTTPLPKEAQSRRAAPPSAPEAAAAITEQPIPEAAITERTAEEPGIPAPRTEEAEAAAPSYVEAPTDETPPAITRLADKPAPEEIAAALGEVSPEAVQQADLTLPGEQQPETRSDEAALSVEPETAQAGARERPAGERMAEPGEARRSGPESGDLMAELEAQAATEMLGQLPASERAVAPTLEPEAPAAAGAPEATPQTTQAPGREFSPEGIAAANAPATPEDKPVAGKLPAPPQEAEATTAPASPPAKPTSKARPRQTTPPKAAASRAPKPPGDQPPAHSEPHRPPQGGGKSPGSRP
ncbi:MAG TPA: alpha/beta fold hydrolase, partial [Ktedonobacterales bacterium]